MATTSDTSVLQLGQLKTFKTKQDALNNSKFALITSLNETNNNVTSLKNGSGIKTATGSGVATVTYTKSTDGTGATLNVNVPAPAQYSLPDATASVKGGVYAVSAGTSDSSKGTVVYKSGTGMFLKDLGTEVVGTTQLANGSVTNAKLNSEVTTKINNKAESSTVTALTNRVTTAENTLKNKIDTSTANDTFATKAQVAAAIIPKGSTVFANLPTPSKAILGHMYNVTNAFTTDANFVDGSGKSLPAGSNVVVVEVAGDTVTYKWDAFSGMVDLSAYATTSAMNTALGNKVSSVNAGTGLTKSGTYPAVTLGITAGGVTSTELASNAVTTVKITDGNVTTAKIANGNVTMTKLASSIQTTLNSVAGKQAALTFATDDDINAMFTA